VRVDVKPPPCDCLGALTPWSRPALRGWDGTAEIGLAVLATTLSIVAVFLPIGFMGGIVGKFFHEFGLTIVVAVLISMFVSFTLDPMLSSIWHDPPPERGTHGWYDRSIGRITAYFDRATQALGRGYQHLLRWSLRHKLATLLLALATLAGGLGLTPLLGAEFVPKADLSETQVNFYTPVGSSLEVTEARARQIDAVLRQLPEVSEFEPSYRIRFLGARSKLHITLNRTRRMLGLCLAPIIVPSPSPYQRVCLDLRLARRRIPASTCCSLACMYPSNLKTPSC
jgi:hypothetical protein